MRPRHKAAESVHPEGFPGVYHAASMRPRHKAAESAGLAHDRGEHVEGFNEAAA